MRRPAGGHWRRNSRAGCMPAHRQRPRWSLPCRRQCLRWECPSAGLSLGMPMGCQSLCTIRFARPAPHLKTPWKAPLLGARQTKHVVYHRPSLSTPIFPPNWQPPISREVRDWRRKMGKDRLGPARRKKPPHARRCHKTGTVAAGWRHADTLLSTPALALVPRRPPLVFPAEPALVGRFGLPAPPPSRPPPSPAQAPAQARYPNPPPTQHTFVTLHPPANQQTNRKNTQTERWSLFPPSLPFVPSSPQPLPAKPYVLHTLPKGWHQMRARDGSTFWQHSVTNATSRRTPPSVERQAPLINRSRPPSDPPTCTYVRAVFLCW